MSPLDKSLILRFTRAQELIALLSDQPTYTHKFSKESLVELGQTLTDIETVSQQCTHSIVRFKELANHRQWLFQKGPQSLKECSEAILDAVGRQHGIKSTPCQLVKLVLHKIKAQNALPAPDDLYSPTVFKELQLYEGSYGALVEHFTLLLSTLELFAYQPSDPSLSQEALHALLVRLKLSSQETKSAQTTLLQAYERRSELFRHLKWRIDSILLRVRHLYGSTNPLYVAARKSKI